MRNIQSAFRNLALLTILLLFSIPEQSFAVLSQEPNDDDTSTPPITQPQIITCADYPPGSNARNACFVAEDVKEDLNRCASSYQPYQVVQIVVNCVEETIVIAAHRYISASASFMEQTTAALLMFAIIVMSIQVIGGVRELNKQVMLFILKFMIIAAVAFNIEYFVTIPFIVLDDLITIVWGGQTPWAELDDIFCKFFGTGCERNHQLQNGFAGLFQAALFSGVQGMLIMLLSLLSTMTMVYFILRAVHTYLASITLIAFITLLSPIMIPLGIFNYSNRFLRKWLNYLIAAMLHPIILFAFLNMLGRVMVYTIQNSIALLPNGNDFSSYWRNNQSLYSWVNTADPRTVQQLESVLGSDTGRAAVHSFISPSMSNAVEVSPLTTFALDFGQHQVFFMQNITFSFLGLFITAYLMMSMVNYLPRISESIAGVVMGLEVRGIPFVSELKHAFSQLKGAIGGTR